MAFEIICDASDNAIGVVFGQRKDKVFHAIYYVGMVLSEAQINYAIIEKELLATVSAFDKSRSYLKGSKVIVYTDHSTFKYLPNK